MFIYEASGQAYGGGGGGGSADLVSPLEEVDNSESLNLFRVLQKTPFTEFTRLVRSSLVHRQLKDTQKTFTIFVPNNNGMSDVPVGCLSKRRNREYARIFVENHIVENAIVWKEDVYKVNQLKLRTVQDTELILKKSNNEVVVYSKPPNEAEAAFSDWKTKNGVLHVIEPALVSPNMPPFDLLALFEQQGLTEFAKLVRIVSLESLAMQCSLRGITAFAPNNNAFKNFASALGVKKGGFNTYVEALYHKLGEVKMKMILRYHLFLRLSFSTKNLLNRGIKQRKIRMGVLTAREKVQLGIKRVNNNAAIVLYFGRLYKRAATIVKYEIPSLVGNVFVLDKVMVPLVSRIKV